MLNDEGKPLYGETVLIPLPRVFTELEVAQLNVALERTARAPRAGRTVHPLSRHIIGLCGRHYTGSNRSGQEQRVYTCSGKTGPEGTVKCSCSQVGAEAIEKYVWSEVCEILSDPERLRAMASDWRGLGPAHDVDYAARIQALQEQVDNHDKAIAAAIVTASRGGGDIAGAIDLAVGQLRKERANLAKLLNEAVAWQNEAHAEAERAEELLILAQVAQGRLPAMTPEEQAVVLDLLDLKVTLLGEFQPKIRRDDQVVGWFQERGREVPLLSDEAWDHVSSLFSASVRGRPIRDPRTMLSALLHKAAYACSWRDLPGKFGPWPTVVSTWRRWNESGQWDEAMEKLNDFHSVSLPDYGVALPPMRIEGKVDPRIIVSTHDTAISGLPNDHIVGLTYVP